MLGLGLSVPLGHLLDPMVTFLGSERAAPASLPALESHRQHINLSSLLPCKRNPGLSASHPPWLIFPLLSVVQHETKLGPQEMVGLLGYWPR